MGERNLRKSMIGTVVSDKMDKTIVVAVETSVAHPGDHENVVFCKYAWEAGAVAERRY